MNERLQRLARQQQFADHDARRWPTAKDLAHLDRKQPERLPRYPHARDLRALLWLIAIVVLFLSLVRMVLVN